MITRFSTLYVGHIELDHCGLAGTPADIRRHPPRLGEHTLEVLREAGLSTAEIDALLATGATRTESSKGASA